MTDTINPTDDPTGYGPEDVHLFEAAFLMDSRSDYFRRLCPGGRTSPKAAELLREAFEQARMAGFFGEAARDFSCVSVRPLRKAVDPSDRLPPLPGSLGCFGFHVGDPEDLEAHPLFGAIDVLSDRILVRLAGFVASDGQQRVVEIAVVDNMPVLRAWPEHDRPAYQELSLSRAYRPYRSG